jgi:hypothetical protein
MVLNPVPGGEEPASQLLQGMPPAEPQRVAARGLDVGEDDALEEASASTAEHVDRPVQSPQLAKDIGSAGDGFVSEPTVRRIDALSAAGCRAQADKLLDAFSSMPRAPLLDLGIELAIRVAPSDMTAHEPAEVVSDVASTEPSDVASQEMTVMAEGAAEDVAASEPKQSAERQALAGEPQSPSAVAQAPARELKRAAPGIEPLASALDAAVRLAADASVAAEALEKLKVLLQHKQQLDGLRSTHPVLALSSLGAETSASEARAIALPGLPPPLPPLPLPVPVAEASMGRTRLPLLQRRRALLERRGVDVRGFMAGFALSWAFGVVLYFFMTAG